jgi:hypothetical protein
MESKLYKIVKAYPFSPPVGTILHYDSFADWYQNANEDYIIESHIIDKYPEYFEQVKDDFFFLVFTIDRPFYNSFEIVEFKEPIDVEEYNAEKDFVKFFKNRKQAEEYVVLNKPCLSITELFHLTNEKDSCISIRRASELKELVKRKIGLR